jgi:site-specific recombinase XerD
MSGKRQIDDPKLFFSMTLEFLEVWLPQQKGRSACTIKSYRDGLTIFRRYLKDELGITIRKFTFAQCDYDCILEFLDYLSRRGCSDRTRNQRLSAIKTYLWFASDKDVALESVALRISKVPVKKTAESERPVLSEAALTAIFDQIPNTRLGLRNLVMLIILYDTAVRIAELLHLRVCDVNLNLESPYIRVLGKCNKERVISIENDTADYIRLYLENFRDPVAPDTDVLFYTVSKGVAGAMSETNFEILLKQYANCAREKCHHVPDSVYPHMFRRSRATHMYQDGVPISLISKILGHVKERTTRIYAKPSLKMMQDAIAKTTHPSVKDEKELWVDEEEVARMCGLR